MILPTAVLFFIVFSLDHHVRAEDPECSWGDKVEVQCPRDQRNGIDFKCRTGFKRKDYEKIFPMINALQLTPSGQCKGPVGCSYCDCKEGYVMPGFSGLTGNECETPFERCPNTAQGQICFHGAKCLEVGDTDEYMCACAYISDKEHKYMGEHCEYKVNENEICEGNWSLEQSYDTKAYCTNNGVCNAYPDGFEDQCRCNEGFYGLHCEYLNEPECFLNCQNGGICNRGFKYNYVNDDYQEDDFAFAIDDGNAPQMFTDDPSQVTDEVGLYVSNDGDDFYTQTSESYCVCPEGFKGETCEYEDNLCDDSICMNGSSCQVDPFNAKGDFYCDCSKSMEIDENGDKIPYAGLKCERIYTNLCTARDGTTSPEFFCTNGGTCPPNIHMPCLCPAGFSGPRCEFEGKKKKECDFPCYNGGSCFFGSRPDEFYSDFNDSEMHCKCPEGWSGIMCEIPIEVCDYGKHHCLNNGECVKNGDDYKCDCDNAIVDTSYAGEYCEHPATSFCIGPGANKDSFCTNHGTCKELVYEDLSIHPGCECDDPFDGDYCEKGATLQITQKAPCLGPGDFVCYNHGSCKEMVDTDLSIHPGCECDNPYFGDLCEFLGGATLEKTQETPCLGPGDFVCYNHGSCKEMVDKDLSIHPGCVCDNPYFGDLCEFKGSFKSGNKAYKAFLGFTISIFGLVAIFFLVVVFRKKKDTGRNMGHTPIGVPTEVHLQALDLDHSNTNTEIMGNGYIDDDEKEVLENVYIS